VSHLPTGFLLHPAAALHDPGWGHVEHQGRLRALASAVSMDMLTLHERVVQLEARSATEGELLRVHTREHLERVGSAVDLAMEEERCVALDSDTLVSGASWDAAVGSSGAVLAAVDGVARGFVRNAFVATRPPGHHATPTKAMGFCLFNHVAVGARYVLDQGLGRKVLIVDWDVHHGNGTQDVFYGDPNVFFLSLHQWPHFPGTGHVNETGVGEGSGTTLNVPLPRGTSRGEYRERFFGVLEEVTSRFSPDWVLVSCGFDVLMGDPLGGQELEPEDMYDLTRAVAGITGGARLVVALEGGYVPQRVGGGTVAVLRALAGLEAP
jgi:acetoin utilization deacetylase AcuC-like enzyme